MTVAQLEEAVSVDEFAQWAAYYKWQGEQRKKALEAAKREATSKSKGGGKKTMGSKKG